MGRGPGVSIAPVAGSTRWRVRWRVSVLDEGTGETKSVQREKVVANESTAIEVQAKVLRDLETGVVPEVRAVQRVPVVATLDSIIAGWIKSRAAVGVSRGGAKPSTLRDLGNQGARILAHFRAVHRLDERTAVPGTVLTASALDDLALAMQADGYGGMTIARTVRALYGAWLKAADDPVTFPGVPTPPRSPDLPGAPKYTAAPAPTMAEVIAMVTYLGPRADRARRFVAIAGWTGLRMGQVLALRWCDVDLDSATVAVLTGKSQQESAGRIVPIAPALVAYLRTLDGGGEDRIVGYLTNTDREAAGPRRALVPAWKAATAKGVRQAAWEGRPEHCLRAAFQHALVEQGVRDEVIDALVGHARTTRDRHYVAADARWAAMQAAVATLPEIPWAEEAALPNVIPIR